jgi:hypothetical protein
MKIEEWYMLTAEYGKMNKDLRMDQYLEVPT